jgi:inosine/xanthosine triphosphatase
MKRYLIAVGSTRRPKLNAVKDAVSAIAPFFEEGTSLEVEGYKVESGVSHTPVARDELMQGARQRVETLQHSLQTKRTSASFFVGLEGGLDVVVENGVKRVFLESWAYASDGSTGHFGCSGSIELPESLAEEVLSRCTELAAAIDRFAGEVGIRDGQGAWGVLSRNLISRQESFRLAAIAAFAPFYNAKMYRKAAASTASSGGWETLERRCIL